MSSQITVSGLPRNIASIAGYSPTTHRAYFKDRRGAAVLSSRDGETFEVTSRVDPDATPAVEVPGHVTSALGEKKWRQNKDYKGISSLAKNMQSEGVPCQCHN